MSQQPLRRTVGDTLTIVQRVRAVPGAVVQPRLLTDSSLVSLLSPPSLAREGDSIRIAYHVAVWQAGTNELTLPGAVIVNPGGVVDTLPDSHVLLHVATVLPNGKAVTSLVPKPARTVIPRGDRSLLPFVVLFALLAIAVAGAAWWLRRRGPERPPPRLLSPPPLDAERLNRWLAAGEAQLALAHVESLLRERPDLADWRGRADEARYARGSDAALVALVREGWEQLT